MPDLSAFVPKGMSLRRTFSSSGTQTARFGTNLAIYDHAQQSDGKIIIGGAFTTYNNVAISGITRIETSGELDTAFNSNLGTGAGSFSANPIDVYSVVVQPDGKILVAGIFDAFSGVAQQGLVRLNSNGTPDTAFNANVANLIDRTEDIYYINSLAVQSDGKIIIGGNFNNLLDSVGTPYTYIHLARLNSNGTIDETFNAGPDVYPDNIVRKIVVQPDDKILVGGDFTTWSTAGSPVSVGRVARLMPSGLLDTTFNTALGTGADSTVRAIAVQSDGSILIGGNFTSFNGTTCDIARVSSSGTFDTSFNTNVGTGVGAGEFIFSISVQSDQKILVGGGFSSWNGATVGDIVRLNSDGTRDTAFTTANGTGAGGGQIRTVSQLSSGDILATGDSFSSWNGTPVNNIVALTSAGAQSTTFLPQPAIVFAVLAGGGGGGATPALNARVGGGGGAGAVVYGLVPFRSTVIIGAGGTPGNSGGISRYSTLYATGGGFGRSVNSLDGEPGVTGAAGGGAGGSSGTSRTGGAGSSLYISVGGAGGNMLPAGSGGGTAPAGISATSGGGGGGAGSTGTTTAIIGGAGGNGLAGGGGGGAFCGAAGVVSRGGNGGSGLGGAGGLGTINTTEAQSGGGGGAGIAGIGNNAPSGSVNNRAAGGTGGLGGGGGGGGAATTSTTATSATGGTGGVGALLIYW